ncbi:hypothetical protein CC80DRAFT_492416 [Byssothecium circinans]|uniref:F-box domain-containing protein n=1 Tax=Byssothecium circinans TaxID=147558 RepID=A0A6A5TVR5_9PLEO|nr:hypothetical protein CC80DRAFT_492416 [Byssothecium circinans]
MAMTGPLGQLPAELQIHIFSYLHNADLKAVRAVSWEFRNNATPRLFRSMVVCARYQGLSALEIVSKDGVLRKNVKEVVLDGSVYNTTHARNLHAYDMATNEYEHLAVAKSWTRRTCWRRYKDKLDEQNDLLDGLVLLHTVAKAIQWMPKLHRLVYSPGPRPIPLEKNSLKNLVPPKCTLDNFDTLHHFIGAIHCEQIANIREFAIDPLGASFERQPFNLHAFNFTSPGHLEAGQFFFRNLHKLHIEIDVLRSGQSDQTALDNLALLLSEAKDLSELSLHLVPWNSRERVMYRSLALGGQSIFSHLGLQTTWPNLRSLSLRGIYAQESEFQGLIDRHRYSLHSLQTELCGLRGGCWSPIVDEVVLKTNISEFVLKDVHEIQLNPNAPFPQDADWTQNTLYYSGHLRINENGGRFFDESRSGQQ